MKNLLIETIHSTTTPLIMGILNVTPDSFSDGGQHNHIDSALRQTELMIKQGASIIDVGGESTRPNAPEVAVEEELSRVVPVIEAIKQKFDVWVSVDSSKAQVMLASARVGADLINDVRALTLENALQAAIKSQLPVCLMHMQGQPATMQNNPNYDELVMDVLSYLTERAAICIDSGIAKSNIVIDPGFGFGKTQPDNFKLLQQLEAFTLSGYPVLSGLSRKSMLGFATGRANPAERDFASVAGAIISAQKGAKIIRVHNVAATNDALAVLKLVQTA